VLIVSIILFYQHQYYSCRCKFTPKLFQQLLPHAFQFFTVRLLLLTAPFLLTNLLLEDLKKAAENGDARVVVVTSALHDPRCCKRARSKTLQFNVSRRFLLQFMFWISY